MIGQRFRELWVVDFEFGTDANLLPTPVCMVAKEHRSGREVRMWRDELRSRASAPFDVGHDSVMVAYSAGAELRCFAALGWPFPIHVIDLFIEDRVATNGKFPPRPLLDVLADHGLAHLESGEKRDMRRLIMERSAWSAEEQVAILDYCASDVVGTNDLLPRMAPAIDLPRALLRGRFPGAASLMEKVGVPLDQNYLAALAANWESLKLHFIRTYASHYGVYEGSHFREKLFAQYLAEREIDWPLTATGKPVTRQEDFGRLAKEHPELEALHFLRSQIGELRVADLLEAVGADGRNRADIFPFAQRTGRNSTNGLIYQWPAWMRGLIKPPEGWAIAYLDWSAQEVAIMAALSGDQEMIEGYVSGDPYLAFAKRAGLVPQDATKKSHGEVRDACKALVLGQNYGMTPFGLARKTKRPLSWAKEVWTRYRELHHVYVRWMDNFVATAVFSGRMETVFGWPQHVGRGTGIRAVMNFPAQGNGAEMMRLAAVEATRRGIQVCCPVHDAFLIQAPVDQIEERVADMKVVMGAAGRLVTGGIDVRVDAQVIRWPDRYLVERGKSMASEVAMVLSGLRSVA